MVALFEDVVVVEEDANDGNGNKQPDKISQMGAKDNIMERVSKGLIWDIVLDESHFALRSTTTSSVNRDGMKSEHCCMKR